VVYLMLIVAVLQHLERFMSLRFLERVLVGGSGGGMLPVERFSCHVSLFYLGDGSTSINLSV